MGKKIINGLILVVTLHFFVALKGLISIIRILQIPLFILPGGNPDSWNYMQAALALFGLVVIIFITLIGIGILKRKKLARILSMIFFPYLFAFSVYTLFKNVEFLMWYKVVIMVSYVSYIYYLTRPKVKEQFN